MKFIQDLPVPAAKYGFQVAAHIPNPLTRKQSISRKNRLSCREMKLQVCTQDDRLSQTATRKGGVIDVPLLEESSDVGILSNPYTLNPKPESLSAKP